jgi:hypothetical protein
METGTPVVIKPIRAKKLAYATDRTISGIAFTSKSMVVENPGGKLVTYSFSKAFQMYFSSGMGTKYLKSSGYLNNPGRVWEKTGYMIPASLRNAKISAKFNPSMVAAAAKTNAAQSLRVVYGSIG